MRANRCRLFSFQKAPWPVAPSEDVGRRDAITGPLAAGDHPLAGLTGAGLLHGDGHALVGWHHLISVRQAPTARESKPRPRGATSDS